MLKKGKQAGAMGTIAPSAGAIALSGLHLAPYVCILRRQVMLYRRAQAIDIFLPRWHQQRAPEVMLYRSAQATDIFLRRWHQQRAPEVMLYRSAQAIGVGTGGATGAMAPSLFSQNCS